MVIGNTFTLPPLPYKGNFQTGASSKESKTVTLFKDIYSYPPQFKLRWDALDEFQTDLCLSSNYGVLEHSFPFIDFIEDWFFNSNPQELVSGSYRREQYLDGYLSIKNINIEYLDFFLLLRSFTYVGWNIKRISEKNGRLRNSEYIKKALKLSKKVQII